MYWNWAVFHVLFMKTSNNIFINILFILDCLLVLRRFSKVEFSSRFGEMGCAFSVTFDFGVFLNFLLM